MANAPIDDGMREVFPDGLPDSCPDYLRPKEYRAMRLRASGMALDRIGLELGIGGSRARQLIWQGTMRAKRHFRPPTPTHRVVLRRTVRVTQEATCDVVQPFYGFYGWRPPDDAQWRDVDRKPSKAWEIVAATPLTEES